MLRLVDQTFHDDGLFAFQKLLHLCRQFLQVVTPDRLAVLRFGEFTEIGVRHSSVGVTLVVEEILPLENHSLELVVEEQNLDTNVVLGGSGKF